MKKISLFLILISIVLMAGAQTKTDEFLKRIPSLPVDSCNITKAMVDSFTEQVSDLYKEIRNEIRQLNNQTKQSAKNSEAAAKDAALTQLSQQYGMSQEDLAKIRNAKNLTPEERKALANKMMSQQTNMSMDEAKSIGNMSDAGKQAYAESYATEAKAVSKVDPKSQAGNVKAENISQLISDQQEITGKIDATSQKILALYSMIENDPSQQIMIDKINKWMDKWSSMSGVDYGQGKQMDSLAMLIKNEKNKYCDKFTPKYRAAIRQHLSILKSSLPDYLNLGNITFEITKIQTGILLPPETKETKALEAINEFLAKLKDAYIFKLSYQGDNSL
jgi:hypothetical protein